MDTLEESPEERLSAEEREDRDRAERKREKEEQASMLSIYPPKTHFLSPMYFRATIFLDTGVGRSRHNCRRPTGNAREGPRHRDSEKEVERRTERARTHHGWRIVQRDQGRGQHLDTS